MARAWKGVVNWELGPIDRSDAVTDFPIDEQHMWRLDGGRPAAAGLEGAYGMRDAFLDASVLNDHSGNAGGMGQDYRFYCMKYALGYGGADGFSVDANVQVGDIYGIARCGTKIYAPGGNGYLGIGFEIMTITSGIVTEIRFGIVDYTGTGAPKTTNFTIAETSATFSVPMSTPVWLVMIIHRTGSGAVTIKLGVDGTFSAGSDPGYVPLRLGWMGPTNARHNGAGTDGGARSWRDLMCWADGSDEADAPPTTTNSIILQPNAVGSVDTWTGTPEATDKHKNVDNKRSDCPEACGYIYPTAEGLANRQSFTFPDVASGTPEAIYVCWEQGNTSDRVNLHRVIAKTTGSSFELLSVLAQGGSNNTAGTMCDGDPDALWHGRIFAVTPADGGADASSAWTLALLNALEAGLQGAADGAGIFRHVGEFYVIVIGQDLVQPDKTACPAAARRVFITHWDSSEEYIPHLPIGGCCGP